MDKRIRRLMFIVFFLVFVIGAPLLVLHTSGYRFDWSQKRLFRTGIISVNTEPKGADVTLNGVIQSKKTPLLLSDLLPGTYTVQISKAGFLPWQENVTVRSQKAAVLGTIDLVLDQPPQVLITRPVTQIKVTADGAAAFVLSQSEKVLKFERVELPTQAAQNLGLFAADTAMLTEPFDDRVIISNQVNDQAKVWLVDAKASSNPLPLDFITSSLSQWQWISSNELIGLSADGLCTVQLAEKSVTCQPFTGQSIWYVNNVLYFLTNIDQTTFLYAAKNRDITQTDLIARLPRSDQYRLIMDNPKIPVLIDLATRDLYTMNSKDASTSLVRLAGAAKDAAWNEDRSQLLYYNDFEISAWQPDDDERALLTRVSQPIAAAAWCGSFPHVIMSYGNKLAMLDYQSSPATTVPLADNVDDWLSIDPSGHWAAYLTDSQSRSTLWLRQLHD